MITKSIRYGLLASAFLISTTSHAGKPQPERPIESNHVTVMQAKAGGTILVRPCQKCQMVSLQFDTDSKAYHNGKTVSLKAIPAHARTAITVIYNPKTKIVHRVIW